MRQVPQPYNHQEFQTQYYILYFLQMAYRHQYPAYVVQALITSGCPSIFPISTIILLPAFLTSPPILNDELYTKLGAVSLTPSVSVL